MNYTLPVAWGLVLMGVLFSVIFGRRVRGWIAAFAISLGLGVLLFIATNVVLAACVSARLCPALGDTGIVYALYPLFAIPVFWLVAGLSARRVR